MTLLRLVIRSLRYYWRTGLAVVFGLAVATAVIVGSLVVGDSVTGSVRDSATARLGRIDDALVAPRFFRAELASDLMRDRGLAGPIKRMTPIITLPAAAESSTTDAVAPNVTVNGVDGSFWGLFGLTFPGPSGREAAISASLAGDLGVKTGDSIIVNVDKQGAIPSGTLFAHRTSRQTLHSLRLVVVRVLDDHGVGGFGLASGTNAVRNVFVSRDWLAAQIGRDGTANAIVSERASHLTKDVTPDLRQALKRNGTLADYGLKLVPNPAQGYVSLQSTGMLLKDQEMKFAQDAARECDARTAVTSVYLATMLRNASAGGAGIAYSVIAAAEPVAPFIVKPVGGRVPSDDSIWLNTWAAEDLNAHISDRIRLNYLVPRPDGDYGSAEITLRVRGIVDMSGPANDRYLVPVFEGITDAERIDQWDPPFPVDLSLITRRDEDYWTSFKATPKAFVSPETMRSIWTNSSPPGSSGWVTSIRIAPPNRSDVAVLARRFEQSMARRMSPEESGMVFRPVRSIAIASSAGSTDFGQLFAAMSLFLVISGAGLAAMLMRLSSEQRAADTGLMMAVGFGRRSVAFATFAQGALLAVAGTLLGVPTGLAYAWVITVALRTRWSGAVGSSIINLHVTPASVIIGSLLGLLVGLLSMLWSIWKLRNLSALQLLCGWSGLDVPRPKTASRRNATVLGVCLVAAIGLMAAGGGSRELSFFSSGALLLASGLMVSNMLLVRAMSIRISNPSLAGLALRGAAANRNRSLLVVGLLAGAAFTVITVAANTRGFSGVDCRVRESGAGGFALRAVSSTPIHCDFGTRKGRETLGFSDEDQQVFEGVRVYSFLMSPGDDISCLNLAKPSLPRVIAVSRRMQDRGGFSVTTATHAKNPWTILCSGTGAIPVFGDSNSVIWNLHSGLGKSYNALGGDGRDVSTVIAGLITQSIFAGELLMSEPRFRQVFPSVDAPRYFLIETPRGREGAVAAALRRNLGRMGLEVRTTAEVLDSYAGVQNTYLSMFLAIGGLGVILGTVGLVAVLFRSALERRREFALLLAQGFGRESVFRLLVMENAGLLAAGVVIGTLSALVAVAPELAAADTRVNWAAIVVLLSGMLIVGFASCAVAAITVAGGVVIEALRGE